MNFLSKLFRKNNIDERLIGCWVSESNETSKEQMIFTKNGKLIYEITENEKVGTINMTYEIQDNFIITDQPSNPKIEKTKFSIKEDLLILDYNGEITKFRKK